MNDIERLATHINTLAAEMKKTMGIIRKLEITITVQSVIIGFFIGLFIIARL